MNTIRIDDSPLTLGDIRAAANGPIRVSIGESARRSIARSHETVMALLETGEPIYGVNTGFGKLASQRIEKDDLAALQRNIVRSHAAGIGTPLDRPVVRVLLLLKLASLARGHSGVRPALVQALADLLEADVMPKIPSQGSVGASGDLAPLAHVALVLIGEGEATTSTEHGSDFRTVSGPEALRAANVEPIELGPKEGLALLNGTQVSTALALVALIDASRSFEAALVAGALSVDAIRGSDTPFDPRIHALRPHQGQQDVAAHLLCLLEGSEIRASHLLGDERVQDPYSFRCQPQVMGACLDLLRQQAITLITEANAVTDNPLVFPDDDIVLSGGNFHAEPVAFAADILALAIAEMGALSERRIAALIDPVISDLPPFLTAHPGLESGYMLAQVTAAALASENKQIAHPASVDSLPTSANQEDHVSMATHAGVRLAKMNANTRGIVAIELLAAAEGIEFRRPLKTSEPLEAAHAAIRQQVPPRHADRTFTPDIEAAQRLIAGDGFSPFVGNLVS